jgi:hypothetical protein
VRRRRLAAERFEAGRRASLELVIDRLHHDWDLRNQVISDLSRVPPPTGFDYMMARVFSALANRLEYGIERKDIDYDELSSGADQ